MSGASEAEIVRLVRTSEGVVPRETAIRNLSTCLEYLERQARDADLGEVADIIALAVLSLREDG